MDGGSRRGGGGLAVEYLMVIQFLNADTHIQTHMQVHTQPMTCPTHRIIRETVLSFNSQKSKR